MPNPTPTPAGMTAEQLRAELIAMQDRARQHFHDPHEFMHNAFVRLSNDVGDLAARLSGMAAVPAWQPMETAPKDRRIELWVPHPDGSYFSTYGRWSLDRFSPRPRPHWHYEASMHTLDRRLWQPTRWRDPPAGPEVAHGQ